MRVKLRGIHKNHRRLAGGRLVTYYYAWRRGPRLVGAPGSAEFLNSYQAAYSSRRTPDRSLFRSIVIAYRVSPEFAKLADQTAANYARYLAKIEIAFAELPVAALDDPRVTRDWREAQATLTTRGRS